MSRGTTWLLVYFSMYLLCLKVIGSQAENTTVPWSVRLVDGRVDSEGRVEVFLDDTWGAICDNLWGPEDAEVVCKQLGYIGADLALVASPFGRGNNPVLLDKVQCNGLESNISTCQHAGVGVKDCHESKIAAVTCTTEGSLRLVNGSTPSEGRIEVLSESGEWGTICDDGWDIVDAGVACRELGYPDALEARINPFPSHFEPPFGQGTGPILLDGVRCSYQRLLRDCPTEKSWGIHDCSHKEDAGVVCDDTTVRMVGGEYPDEGRVEVFYGGTWGTICTHEWSIEDAHVFCRQLGYPLGARSIKGVPSDRGNVVLLDGLQCNGSEASLSDCPSSGWANNENCDSESAQVAGVVCNVPSVVIDLLSGSSSLEGVVRYREDTTSGLICDEDWGNREATVVCRQLGYAEASSSKPVSLESVRGNIFYRDYQCEGTESQLSECAYNRTLNPAECVSDYIAQVTCGPPKDFDIRADGSEYPEQGRVDVFLNGEWGLLTDSYVSYDVREVCCRQLGYAGSTVAYFYGNVFQRGVSNILIKNIGCSGSEKRIQDCPTVDLVSDGDTHTTPDDSVEVVCYPYESVANHPVRLIDADGNINNNFGMVQIYNGHWGAVCDSTFGGTDVLCRELGHSNTDDARYLYSYEYDGTAWEYPDIWFEFSYCPSDVDKIFECYHEPWGYSSGCSGINSLAFVTCVPYNPETNPTSGPYYPDQNASGLEAWQIIIVAVVIFVILFFVACCCWRGGKSQPTSSAANGIVSAAYVPTTNSTHFEVSPAEASCPPPAYVPPSPEPVEAPPTYESVTPYSVPKDTANDSDDA
ncbi:scavenger receptor cysteine-rich domain-containing group B protein-like [Diadema antillarum]|uniref:scavenger receptor cysteine-rich domain-containing group B protein-like n=1 Tax=Diadema antillarum TaxID=105358 RepID=UPI003A8AD0AA